MEGPRPYPASFPSALQDYCEHIGVSAQISGDSNNQTTTAARSNGKTAVFYNRGTGEKVDLHVTRSIT